MELGRRFVDRSYFRSSLWGSLHRRRRRRRRQWCCSHVVVVSFVNVNLAVCVAVVHFQMIQLRVDKFFIVVLFKQVNGNRHAFALIIKSSSAVLAMQELNRRHARSDCVIPLF
jgi:hypothetical protein